MVPLQQLPYSLVVGIVSGVLATFLVVVFRAFWTGVVEPWLEERSYRGPRVEGVWQSEITFPDGEKNRHRLQLQRTGYKISGRTVCYEGYSKGNSYDINGSLNNSILTCTYTLAHPRRIERGSMVLMLVNDSRSLSGHLLYYDDRSHSVRSTPCEWTAEELLGEPNARDH